VSLIDTGIIDVALGRADDALGRRNAREDEEGDACLDEFDFDHSHQCALLEKLMDAYDADAAREGNEERRARLESVVGKEHASALSDAYADALATNEYSAKLERAYAGVKERVAETLDALAMTRAAAAAAVKRRELASVTNGELAAMAGRVGALRDAQRELERAWSLLLGERDAMREVAAGYSAVFNTRASLYVPAWEESSEALGIAAPARPPEWVHRRWSTRCFERDAYRSRMPDGTTLIVPYENDQDAIPQVLDEYSRARKGEIFPPVMPQWSAANRDGENVLGL